MSHGDPGVALAKRSHDRRIELAIEVCLRTERLEAGKPGHAPDIRSRLVAEGGGFIESLLPELANRVVIMRRIGRDGKALVSVAPESRNRDGLPIVES